MILLYFRRLRNLFFTVYEHFSNYIFLIANNMCIANSYKIDMAYFLFTDLFCQENIIMIVISLANTFVMLPKKQQLSENIFGFDFYRDNVSVDVVEDPL